MTPITQTNKAGFEVTTCSRCGGTGHYSFNQINGTTCFGCNGGKVKLTARGAAAHALFVASTSVPTSEIVVGDKIFRDGGWRLVRSITLRPAAARYNGVSYDYISLETQRIVYSQSPATLVRVSRGAAAWAAKLAEALAYQATLGVSGKPLKKVEA